MLCTRCGCNNSNDSLFCEKCGTPLSSLQSNIRMCAVCGAYIRPEMRFCESCGNPVNYDVSSDAMESTVLLGTENYNPYSMNAQMGSSMYNDMPLVQPSVNHQVTPTGCGYYGVPHPSIPNIQHNAPLTPKKKKKSKAPAIIIIIIAAIILGGSIIYGVITMLPENRIMSAYEARNYSKMREIYDGTENDRLNKKLIEEIEEIENEFISGKEDYKDACNKIEAIMSLDINSVNNKASEVKGNIGELNESHISYKAAENAYGSGDYGKAIELYRSVIESDDNYSDAQKKIEAATNKYRDEVLKETNILVQSGDFDSAIKKISEALDVINYDTVLWKEKNDIEDKKIIANKEKIIAEAEEKIKAGDYESAINILRPCMNTYSDDVQIKYKYEDCCNRYVELILGKSRDLVKIGNNKQAIEILNKALDILPSNELLTARLREIEQNKSVPINNMVLIDGGFKWNQGSPIDSAGNDYSYAENYTVMDPGTNPIIAEYRLNGNYNTISGIIAPHKKMWSDRTAYVVILADGEPIYTSKEFTSKTAAFRFEKSIAGVSVIRIEIRTQNGHLANNSTILANVMLNP